MTTTLSSISTSPLPWPNQRELPETTRPLPAGTTVISADSHWLETGEFIDRMPAKYRDRAPRGVFNERGFHMEIDGQTTDNPAMPSEMIEGRAGMWDAGIRVEEISREGVDQEILFPQRMLGVIRNRDFDYIQACMDAYNEMLAEFCAEYPDKLHGLALLNYWNPEGDRGRVAEDQGARLQGCPHALAAAAARQGLLQRPRPGADVEGHRRIRPAAQLPRRRDLRRPRSGRSGHDHRGRLPALPPALRAARLRRHLRAATPASASSSPKAASPGCRAASSTATRSTPRSRAK